MRSRPNQPTAMKEASESSWQKLLWTVSALLLTLIAALIASSDAEAQPQAVQQPSQGLNPAKCSDGVERAQKLLKAKIILAARAANTERYLPSMSYEADNSTGYTREQKIDFRAEDQANKIIAGLFASAQAVARNPAASVADAASLAMTGDAKRRATVEMYNTCRPNEQPVRVVSNNLYQPHPEDCQNSVSMGINSTQVFQTRRSPEEVKNSLARYLVSAPGVTVCESKQCDLQGKHSARNPSSFQPKLNQDYFLRTTVAMKGSNMVNDAVMKMTEVDICGTKAYLVQSFGNGGSLGFDRSSVIQLIAPVGNQTLVLGDASAQAYRDPSSNQTVSWPLWFPVSKIGLLGISMAAPITDTPKALFDIYPLVARQIGSTEQVMLGKIGGSPGFNRGHVRTNVRATVAQ